MIIDGNHFLVVIAGPTAVGKTSLSISIAKHFSAEIISADSRQFYREMIIGTARPSDSQLKEVPHHFIGHISIHDRYNVSRFETDVLSKLEDLFSEHRIVIMTGGSGLYIEAVCKGIDDLPDPDESVRTELKELYHEYGIQALRNQLKILDPEYYSRVDLANPNRLLRALEVCITTGLPYSSLRRNIPKERHFNIIRIGLEMPVNELEKRIRERTTEMIKSGLVAEARQLMPFRDLNALNTVGYKEMFEYLSGTITLEEAERMINTNTRRYAKRQMTWFRKQADFTWFTPEGFDTIIDYLDTIISRNPKPETRNPKPTP